MECIEYKKCWTSRLCWTFLCRENVARDIAGPPECCGGNSRGVWSELEGKEWTLKFVHASTNFRVIYNYFPSIFKEKFLLQLIARSSHIYNEGHVHAQPLSFAIRVSSEQIVIKKLLHVENLRLHVMDSQLFTAASNCLLHVTGTYLFDADVYVNITKKIESPYDDFFCVCD